MENPEWSAQRSSGKTGFNRVLSVVVVILLLVIAAFTISFLNNQNAASTVTNVVSETTTRGIASTTTVTQVEISKSTLFDTTRENYPGTTTQVLTTPCPFPSSTTTNGNSANSSPNFSALFGNFSQMTVAVTISNSNAINIVTASFVVLNRTSLGSQEIYEVNATTNIVQQNIGAVPSSNLTTTIMESMLASVSSNGTVISAISPNNEAGNSASSIYQQNMNFFPIFNLENFPPDHSVVINRTKVTIGSTSMNVTNYAVPSTIAIQTMQNCGSPATGFTESLLNPTMQAGIVPGTSFTLLTMYVFHVSVVYNSTSSGGIQEYYQFRVASFEKA